MNKGLTLTELLISITLISVIMLGMGSLMFNMQSGQQVTQESTAIGMHATAAMAHIRRNVSRAMGDASSPGIVTNADYFSIRQDLNSPGNYDDDTWVIYTRSLGTRNQLHVCTQTAAQGSAPLLGSACAISNSEELLNNLQDDNSTTTDFNASLVTADPNFYLEVTLTTIADPTQAFHALTNPKYSITTRIAPAGHSWSN